MGFCKEYNARTSNRMGDIIPAEITIFSDSSFRFELKSPPTAFLIRKAAGVEKGASNPLTEKVGQLNRRQVKEIAEVKMPDLNTSEIAAAMRQVEGTARQMGIIIVD